MKMIFRNLTNIRENMNNLTDLGIKHGTDKVNDHHSFAGECYTDIYHKYLNGLREKSFNFLEIGVRDGSSLRMWSEYFPNAQIIGIDIDPECKRYETENIKVEIGPQEDELFLKNVIEKYKTFRVVLDDGSHINDLTIKSFEILQPFVTDFYIIEDLSNSYEDLTTQIYAGNWPGMHLIKNLNLRNDITRTKFNNILLSLIKSMDYKTGRFKSIHAYSQIIIMEKYENINYTRTQ